MTPLPADSADSPFAKKGAVPSWAAVGAVSAIAPATPPKSGLLQKAVFGALKAAGIASVSFVFFLASAWGLHQEVKAAQEGRIDMSDEAIRARKASGAAPLPLSDEDLAAYAEATLYSGLAYKKDWKAEVAAGACHSAIRVVDFFPERFGGFEKNVSAMRVFAAALPQKTLVVSFSGSDDLLDFVRDSNGFGVLSSLVSPRSSFKELEPGVRAALDLIEKSHADYDRVVIVGHSLGGHLANEFAHRLAQTQSHLLRSEALAKTELLTLNTLYLDRPEPLCLGRVAHFREALELTDHVGKISGLRAPSQAFVHMVSAPGVADDALQEQLRLRKKIAEDFSPLDFFRQIRIIFSYGIERMEHMIDRHMGSTAQRRVQEAVVQSALIAEASANAAENLGAPSGEFAASQSQGWAKPDYGSNTLRAHSQALPSIAWAQAPLAQLASPSPAAIARQLEAAQSPQALAGLSGFEARRARQNAVPPASATDRTPPKNRLPPSFKA